MLSKNKIKENNSKKIQSKTEGWLDCLSYVGWMLIVIFPLTLFILLIYDIRLPFFSNNLLNILLTSFGLILTLITIFKSKYPISLNTQRILLFIFILATPIFDVVVDIFDMVSETRFLLYPIWLWTFLLVWYSHYFYKKSKDGYRRIWLKLLLVMLVLMVPLFVLLYGFFRVSSVECFDCDIQEFLG